MYISELSTPIAITQSNCDRVTSHCNQVLPLITDARIFEQRLNGYRYFVELISQFLEFLDSYSVPRQAEIVDLVVIEPKESAIRSLIAACEWLENFTIVRFWQPVDCTEF